MCKLKKIFSSLIGRVLIAMLLGVLLGIFMPIQSSGVKIFSDVFVKLINLLVSPIVFCTIIGGIVQHKDIKALGKVALIAIIYFEIISIIALGIGVFSCYLFKPGVGCRLLI